MGHFKSSAFCLLFLAAPVAASAQAPVPGQWASVVMEGAMGQSMAFFLGEGPDPLSASLHCLGRDRYLTIDIGSASSQDVFPDGGEINPRYLRTGGRDYLLPAPIEDPWNHGAWPGQQEMLRSLYAGNEAIVLIAPEGDLSRAVEIGRIPALRQPEGLAYAAADCGGLPSVSGPVETIPPYEGERNVGAWLLRDRGENFATPIAVNIIDGGTLSLFCDGAGVPSAAEFGLSGDPERLVKAQSTVRVWIDGTPFDFVAAPYGNHVIFQVSRAFIEAAAGGRTLSVGPSLDDSNDGTLAGTDSAIAHAYRDCGPPMEF